MGVFPDFNTTVNAVGDHHAARSVLARSASRYSADRSRPSAVKDNHARRTTVGEWREMAMGVTPHER